MRVYIVVAWLYQPTCTVTLPSNIAILIPELLVNYTLFITVKTVMLVVSPLHRIAIRYDYKEL